MSKNFIKIIFVFAFATAFTFLLDRVLKGLAVTYLVNDITLIPDFLRLTLGHNTGVAFGIQLPYVVQLALVPILIFGGLYVASHNLKIERNFTLITVGAIVGGATSNYVDRLMHGYVIDYISVWIWPVFNLADVAITVGIFLLVIFYGKIKKV